MKLDMRPIIKALQLDLRKGLAFRKWLKVNSGIHGILTVDCEKSKIASLSVMFDRIAELVTGQEDFGATHSFRELKNLVHQFIPLLLRRRSETVAELVEAIDLWIDLSARPWVATAERFAQSEEQFARVTEAVVATDHFEEGVDAIRFTLAQRMGDDVFASEYVVSCLEISEGDNVEDLFLRAGFKLILEADEFELYEEIRRRVEDLFTLGTRVSVSGGVYETAQNLIRSGSQVVNKSGSCPSQHLRGDWTEVQVPATALYVVDQLGDGCRSPQADMSIEAFSAAFEFEFSYRSVLGDQAELPYSSLVPLLSLSRNQRVLAHVEHLTPRPPWKSDRGLGSLVLSPKKKQLVEALADAGASEEVSDFVFGKSQSRTVLLTGPAGVGKTLIAQSIASRRRQAVYSVSCSVLGDNVHDVSSNLEVVLQRVRRLNLTLLIDDAEVYIATRGRDITQLSIINVILSTLEQNSGWAFLTTNMEDTVDPAVVSRCFVCLKVPRPTPVQRRQILTNMLDNNGIRMPASVVTEVARKHSFSGRDLLQVVNLLLALSQKAEKASPKLLRLSADTVAESL